MSEHLHRSHNVSVLLYHIVCPAKYRRAVVSGDVDKVLRDVCLDIAARYDITVSRDRDGPGPRALPGADDSTV